jgi:hypothetical protein
VARRRIPRGSQPTGDGGSSTRSTGAAFAKAKVGEDVLPYLSKRRVAMVDRTPREDRAKMLGLMKALDVQDIKVLKESRTETGYMLEAVGKGGLGPVDAKGTISIVREDGKLKLDTESWKQ